MAWRNSTTRSAWTPARRNGNINLNKYFISRVAIEPTISRVHSHILCPCATTGLIFIYKLLAVDNFLQCYFVSRTQHDSQRQPSVKTLCSPHSAELWRHCVLRGGVQRRALTRYQSGEMKIINI